MLLKCPKCGASFFGKAMTVEHPLAMKMVEGSLTCRECKTPLAVLYEFKEILVNE